MSNILNISPVLPVADLKKELAFFKHLGFLPVYDSLQYSDQLDYSVVQLGKQTIHLQLFDENNFQGQQVKIWVSEIDKIDEELSELGIPFNRNFDTPWNTHEIGLFSPSRHAIFFVQVIS